MAFSVFRPNTALSLSLLLSGWLACAVPSALAQAQPQAQLGPPQADGFYQPQEPLHLFLPDDLRPDAPGSLSFELDGMDVSALVEQRGANLVYVPVRPLAPGHHELRVVFYGEQGLVQELGYWAFDVRHSQRFKELKAQGQFDVALSQRVAEHNQGGGSDFRAQGGGYLESGMSGDNWRLDSSLDLMAVNDAELAVSGRRVDLARFNLRGVYDRYQLALGDQRLASASLIQDGFERRGISTSAQLPVLDGSISLYQAGSQQQVGIDAGLGNDDADNRLTGGRLELWPLRSDSAQLMVSGEQLSGRVSEPDYGSFDPDAGPVIHEGEAWNLTMDGLFFNRQLRLRYEHAGSEYDFDGIDGDFEPERDNAWAALAVFDPTPVHEINWRLGLESRKMGTYYKSLANRYAPADKQMERLFFDISRDKWRWDGGYAVEDSNLSEDTAYAISESRQWHLNAGYFDYEPPEGPVLALLGQPSYTLSAGGATLKDSYTPEGFLVNDLETRRYGITAAFAKQQLQWSAGYHYDTLDDVTGWQPKARTQTTQLDAGWQASRYRLFASWQLQDTRYPEQGVSTSRHIYSLDSQAELIPDRLRGSLNIGLNQTNAMDDPFFAQRDKDTYVSANLTWQIREPDIHLAGLEMIFSFTRNDYRDRLFTAGSQDGYQAFIEFRSGLPVAYPGGRP